VLPRRSSVAFSAGAKTNTGNYAGLNSLTISCRHRKVEEQEATIAQLKSALAKQETVDAEQQKQIEALTAGLQKVSAHLDLNKTASQIVLNNQ
jgi:uncharacterized coiled-coil protein SlyX